MRSSPLPISAALLTGFSLGSLRAEVTEASLEFVLTVDGTEHAVDLDEAYQGTFGSLDVLERPRQP